MRDRPRHAAHPRGALDDGFLQRAPPALVDVVFGKGALGGCDLHDRFLQRPLLRLATIENAGFVEMDVRLDEPGRHQPPADIFARHIGGNCRCDLGDLAGRNTDIECPRAAPGNASVAKQEIKHGYNAASVPPR